VGAEGGGSAPLFPVALHARSHRRRKKNPKGAIEMSHATKKKKRKSAEMKKRDRKAPWGYRIDGKPKRKPGRKKGSKNRKANKKTSTVKKAKKAKRGRKGKRG